MARPAARVLLTLALGVLPGCQPDRDPAVAEPTEPSGAQPERPRGWVSLEGDETALRLYYQFVDAAGRVRFVERLEDVPERWRANVGFVKMAGAPPLSPADAERARREQVGRLEPAAAAGTVPILYGAEWCGACRKAKRYLTRRGVDFEERDVDVPAAAEELRRKTGSRAIPVLDAGGRILTGFSPSSYGALLDRS